jgi:hypothetical protein
MFHMQVVGAPHLGLDLAAAHGGSQGEFASLFWLLLLSFRRARRTGSDACFSLAVAHYVA